MYDVPGKTYQYCTHRFNQLVPGSCFYRLVPFYFLFIGSFFNGYLSLALPGRQSVPLQHLCFALSILGRLALPLCLFIALFLVGSGNARLEAGSSRCAPCPHVRATRPASVCNSSIMP